jgi:RNA polymerase sigma-70 factor (ECF subfamily)
MDTFHFPLQPELLLAHEPFVRGVARSLLGRGDGTEDLVQDTWLAALTHPPRSAGSIRAFLGAVARNHALNERRSVRSRVHREQIASRTESVESVATIHERLSVQREVVDAVLSLDEPYRGAVMLHYYDDLSAAEIAERRGVPAGTVRSQLSRALVILRAKLDAKFGGDRAAWGAVLIPWLERASPVAHKAVLSGKAVLVVATLLVASIAPIVWLNTRARTSIEAPAQLAGPLLVPLSTPMIAEAPPDSASTDAVGGSRQVAGPSHYVATASSKPDLGSKSIEELHTLLVQAERVLETKLYTPDPRLVESETELLALPGTGMARILTSTKYAALVTPESADSFYACAFRNHGDEEQPDLRYVNERLSAPMVYGSHLSFACDLGNIDMMSVRGNPAVRPDGMDEHAQSAWALCWSRPVWLDRREDASPEDSWEEISRIGEMCNRDYRSAWESASHLNLFLGVRPRVGGAFLVRQIERGNGQHLEGSRDLLAIVKTIQLDQDGCTIAWRILRSWRIDWPLSKKGRSFQPRSDASVPAASESLCALGVSELVDLIHDIRANATSRIVSVPQGLSRKYATELAVPDTRLVRLPFDGGRGLLGETFGPGSVDSFLAREKNEDLLFNVGPDAGIYRARGKFILDLGSLPLAAVVFSPGSAPAALQVSSRDAWRLMWTSDLRTRMPGVSMGRRARNELVEESSRWRHASREPEAVSCVEVGHTYLLRSEFGPHDVLVAFTTVDRDAYGDTLLWRTLKTWPPGDTVVRQMIDGWPLYVSNTR